MKICYDNIIYFLQSSGGISKYWYELTKRLVSVEDVQFVEYGRESGNFFRSGLALAQESTCFDIIHPLKLARYMPVFNSMQGCDLFHSSYYRVPADKSIKNVVTVHDFTYEHFFSGLKKRVHSWQKAKAVRNADRVICISESTKRDLLHFYPDVDESRLDVVYNGVNEEFRRLAVDMDELRAKHRLESGVEYAVFVGARSFYKNFDIAVDACALAGVGLIVVGGGAFSEREKSRTERLLGSRCIHFDQTVDIETLNELYNISLCLLYPSSYEGFGIPAAEALNAGCIPLVVNVSSLPEVAGARGLYCDSASADCFAENITKLLDKRVSEELLLRDHPNFGLFNWDTCFKKTLDVYNQALQD